MGAPKPEHVAELMNGVGNLISANGEHERGSELARFARNLADRLDADIKANETMKRRGHGGQRKAFDVLAPMLSAYADALAAHKPVSTEPIKCTARNQLDAVCIRTDAGHTSHTYPPVDPQQRGKDIAAAATDPERVQQVVQEMVMATCGMVYPGSTDPCLLEPRHVLRRESHQARHSRWPVIDADVAIWSGDAEEAARLAIYEPLKKAHASDKEQILAFLKGETDELGTEPLFIEPRGEVTATGTVAGKTVTMQLTGGDAEMVTAGVLKGYSVGINNPRVTSGGPSGYVELGLSDPVTIIQDDPIKLVPEVLLMQPDPFADAGVVPDSEIRRDYSWRPDPDPRPLWLPRESAPLIPNSIRVTAVRTGEQCGMAYRLISRDQVPEVPAWWNVGGHTLHACAQHLEGMYLSGNYDVAKLAEIDEMTARAWWDHHWTDAVALTERESPGFERRHWRAANKGTEGADWWNEVGPHMVRDYAAASAQWHAQGWSILHVQAPTAYDQYELAMELEMRSPLPTGGELVGHLDSAWWRDGEIRIRDLKTSKELPTDEWQLDAYAYLLRRRLREAGSRRRATFSVVHYDARNGKDAEVRVIDTDPIENDDMALVYRASSVLRMHESNNYPANPGSDWKAPCYLCPVRYACPIMALKG